MRYERRIRAIRLVPSANEQGRAEIDSPLRDCWCSEGGSVELAELEAVVLQLLADFDKTGLAEVLDAHELGLGTGRQVARVARKGVIWSA